MRITPGESWTWSYRSIEGQDYLGLFITNEKGMKYFFRTNFMVQHLRTFPEYGSPFTVRDAQLLNDFMAGLMAVGIADNDQGKDVSTSMEIALNAVACALLSVHLKEQQNTPFYLIQVRLITLNEGK